MIKPNVSENYYQERAGVLKVAMELNKYGFIFRETTNGDIGIDGQIEHVNESGEATGKIVAAQIKSGDSYLTNKEDHYAFYPKEKHRNYWSTFPLPVILFVNYPKDDKIYFTDVRYQLSIPKQENTYIHLNKLAYLNQENAKQIFKTVGSFDTPYHPIEEVFDIMLFTICKNPTFSMSYLDLFTQGLTNLCRHVYCSMDLAMEIAEYNNTTDYGIGLGFEEHQFLHSYAKFIMSENLANIDYSDYLIDWNERQLQPTFIAPINKRGHQLLDFIKGIEASHKQLLPPTTLIRERSIEMKFRTNDDYLRLELGKVLKKILAKVKE